ncbi:hypothetical protein [Flavobacterium sp.]|uniref:hypothetical protein n=1 Tax=Flavobacterium sp. TaxID=239 RepID=UPI003B9ABADD
MKSLKIIICVLIFLIGFSWGCFIQKYPFLKFNSEVKIFEVLNFFLTAAIGLLIPFFIKKWIEDGRYIKNNLIAELKETLTEIITIRDKVKSCFSNGSINSTDKQFIIVQFEEIDLKLNGLHTLLCEYSKIKAEFLFKEIKEEYLKYWKLTTGEEIMSSNFVVVSQNFYREHNEVYSNLETKVKTCINKIHMF